MYKINSISRRLFFYIYSNHPMSYFLLNKNRISSTISNNNSVKNNNSMKNNNNDNSFYKNDNYFHKDQLISKELALKRQNYVANIVKYYNTHKLISYIFNKPLYNDNNK